MNFRFGSAASVVMTVSMARLRILRANHAPSVAAIEAGDMVRLNAVAPSFVAAAQRLLITVPGAKGWLDKVIKSLEEGLPLLLENMKDAIEAIIDNVVARAFVKKGLKLQVYLGDRATDVATGRPCRLVGRGANGWWAVVFGDGSTKNRRLGELGPPADAVGAPAFALPPELGLAEGLSAALELLESVSVAAIGVHTLQPVTATKETVLRVVPATLSENLFAVFGRDSKKEMDAAITELLEAQVSDPAHFRDISQERLEALASAPLRLQGCPATHMHPFARGAAKAQPSCLPSRA